MRLREAVSAETLFQADVAALSSQWRICLRASPGSTQGSLCERPVAVFSSSDILPASYGAVSPPKACKPEDMPFAEVNEFVRCVAAVRLPRFR
jgi:hypothetical protein